MRTHQEWVSIAAYHLWQSAGSPDGRDLEFWFTAERHFLLDGTRELPRKNGDLSMPRCVPTMGPESNGRSHGSSPECQVL